MRTTNEIALDIKKVVERVIEPSDEGSLACEVTGDISGIPVAFVEALDHVDPSGYSSETLHKLVVEYSNGFDSKIGAGSKVVFLHFSGGNVSISTE